MNVYVDGEDVRTSGGLDAPVRENATIVLLPAMAGGDDRRLAARPDRRTRRSSQLDAPLAAGRDDLRQARGQNPTGSIKDRVALAMVDAAGLQPGAGAARADERQHGHLAGARREAPRPQAHLRHAGQRDTGAPARARAVRGEHRRLAGGGGSNGAVRVAQEMAAADPRYTMLFQYANEWNPRAHYEGTGAEIVRDLPAVDALVAGLGTGGTLMGTGARLREAFPDVVVAAAEPLPGRPRDGTALARGRLRAPDPRRLEARPQDPRLERRVGRRGARAARARGHLRRRLRGRGRPRRAPDRRRAARPARSSSPCSPTAAGSTSRATSGGRGRRASRWRAPSGGSPGRRSARSCTPTPPRRRRTSAAA